MVSVRIRELRQRASELLRQVALGETIEIADRGRRVAWLGPIDEGSELERMRAAGEVRSAVGDLDDLPVPITLTPDPDVPSLVLARLRRDER